VLLSSYFADAELCPPAVDQQHSRIFAGDVLGHLHVIRVGTGGSGHRLAR
jgi:hypothetical protein